MHPEQSLCRCTTFTSAKAALIVLLTSLPQVARANKVAITEMRTNGVSEQLGRTLTEVLSTETAQRSGLTVVSASDVDAMLGFDQQKQLLGCQDDVACIAEIGGALGVDLLLVSDLGLVGKTYVLNMKLINTSNVKVLNRIYKTATGEPDVLIGIVRASVPELLKPLSGPPQTEAQTAAAAKLDSVPPQAQPEDTPVAATTNVQELQLASTGATPSHWPQWTLIGTSSAVLLTGVGLSVATRVHSYDSQVTARNQQGGWLVGTGADYLGYESDKSTNALGVALALVGAAGLGGGIWWLLATDEAPTASVAPTFSKNLVAVAAVCRF